MALPLPTTRRIKLSHVQQQCWISNVPNAKLLFLMSQCEQKSPSVGLQLQAGSRRSAPPSALILPVCCMSELVLSWSELPISIKMLTEKQKAPVCASMSGLWAEPVECIIGLNEEGTPPAPITLPSGASATSDAAHGVITALCNSRLLQSTTSKYCESCSPEPASWDEMLFNYEAHPATPNHRRQRDTLTPGGATNKITHLGKWINLSM